MFPQAGPEVSALRSLRDLLLNLPAPSSIRAAQFAAKPYREQNGFFCLGLSQSLKEKMF